jgi:hypothetical protein
VRLEDLGYQIKLFTLIEKHYPRDKCAIVYPWIESALSHVFKENGGGIYMWEKIGRSISNRSQRFIITKLIQKRNMVGVFVMNANIFIIVTGDTMILGNGT